MKIKKVNKKLSLIRTTVANLNTVEMDNVRGGEIDGGVIIKVSNCCSNPCGSSTHVGCSGGATLLG